MRSRSLAFCTIALAFVCGAGTARAQDVAFANVQVRLDVATRTSLKVSSEVLRFDVAQSGGTATATIDFSAGARMSSGGNVVLSVEPLRAVEGPGGAADVESSVSFAGSGPGLLAGALRGDTAVVGQWHGSGLREGRVVFTLRANASGTYTLPVRFVLSTP
jgi:hypothetical protein